MLPASLLLIKDGTAQIGRAKQSLDLMFERGVRALRSLGWQRAMHSDRKQSGREIHLTRAAFKANSSRVSPNQMVQKATKAQSLLDLEQK